MERKNTFNDIANEYDRFRPNYPDELFTDIVKFAGIGKDAAILEIGCGTGQATKGFVNDGYENLTCIELGENLAKLTREKFKDKTNVKIINTDFETWRDESSDFDLAISGTAFHFIQPQEIGYRKVYNLLNEQGSIAFFWTVHVPSYDDVFNKIRDSYKRYAPQVDDSKNPSIEQIITERSHLTLKDGLFKELEVKQYRWSDTYTANEYISLLNTNSRHQLLPEGVRFKLFREINEAIEECGGTVIKPQAVVLYLARKNPQ